MYQFSKKLSSYFLLAVFCTTSINLNANFFEKIVSSISEKTSLSPRTIKDSALIGLSIASLITVISAIKYFDNCHQEKNEIAQKNLTDNEILQEERSNLAYYKEIYEPIMILVHDTQALSMAIKKNNTFPYFIPYRSKVALAHANCTKSLENIIKRLDPNFITLHPRNTSELQQLKNEYVLFIDELDSLKAAAYKCIKSSYIENILMWWVTDRARDAKNSLEPNRYHFTYLVEDLI